MATEVVLFMLDGMGMENGVNMNRLLAAGAFISEACIDRRKADSVEYVRITVVPHSSRSLSMCIAVLSALLLAVPVFATGFPPFAPELKALDVQAGHWIYHDTTAPEKEGGKAGTFTRDEHCGWSATKLFLLCSFDNDWSGHKAQSLVADTRNTRDKSYWHYEMFAVGSSGAKPFASRMSIRGNTWTETGEEDALGKKNYDRISYVYTSPTEVTVKIEVSPDQKQWKTTLQGIGVKQL